MADVRILEQVEIDEKDAPAPTNKWLTFLIEAVILLLAILLVVLIRVSWLEPASVTSRSMENTIKVGERFLVDHRKSLRGSWKRGDIVLIETKNDDWGDDTLVKRVIGLPGETIELVNGQVFVNRNLLKENYLKEPSDLEDVQSTILGAGQYFVMGDNRNNSGDSRDFGPVSSKEIKGRVTRKIWPLQALPQPDYGD